MASNGEMSLVGIEVRIGGKDSEAVANGDRANKEVGGGSLNASLPAMVIIVGCVLVVLLVE